MVDADEFVDGDSVDVTGLVGTIVGSVLVAIWAGVTGYYRSVAGWLAILVTSSIEAVSMLFVDVAAIPGNVLGAAWAAAAASISDAGSFLGPFVYPVAIAATFATLLLVQRTLERTEVIP